MLEALILGKVTVVRRLRHGRVRVGRGIGPEKGCTETDSTYTSAVSLSGMSGRELRREAIPRARFIRHAVKGIPKRIGQPRTPLPGLAHGGLTGCSPELATRHDVQKSRKPMTIAQY